MTNITSTRRKAIIRTAITAAGLACAAPAAAQKDEPRDSRAPYVLAVDSVRIDKLPPVELAPDQLVRLKGDATSPNEIIIRQAFANTGNGVHRVTFNESVILRSVTVVPASIDTSAGLYNCTASVRWNDLGQLHPDSNDRYLLAHSWGGSNQVALNYALPYTLRLPAGSPLAVQVSRAGGSGFCEAVVNLTGTVTR